MLKTQRNVSLINTCNATYDEDELISAMLWYSDKPIMSVKKSCYVRTIPRRIAW